MRQVTLARAVENRIFNENRWCGEEECDVGTHDDDLVVMTDNPPGEASCPQQAGFLCKEMEDSNRPGHQMV